jgi:hypothetical protein
MVEIHNKIVICAAKSAARTGITLALHSSLIQRRYESQVEKESLVERYK